MQKERSVTRPARRRAHAERHLGCSVSGLLAGLVGAWSAADSTGPQIRWAGRKAERMSYLPKRWNLLSRWAGWSGPPPPPSGTIHDRPWDQVPDAAQRAGPGPPGRAGARVGGGSRSPQPEDRCRRRTLIVVTAWGTGVAATVRIMFRASARPTAARRGRRRSVARPLRHRPPGPSLGTG